MSRMWVIACHEWRRLFSSPLAWACLGIVQLILGIVFWLLLAEFATLGYTNTQVGVAEFVGGGLFGFSSIVFLIVVPLLAMRSFAEERHSGSLELLLASPASLSQIVVGKFLGLLGFLWLMLGLTALMPLSLQIGTNLDLGLLASAILGVALMLAAFASASIFVSVLCPQPVVAALAGFGLLLVLWLLQVAGAAPGPVAALAEYLSLLSHFDALRRGVFDLADVAYYLLFCAAFLGFAIQRLTWERQA